MTVGHDEVRGLGPDHLRALPPQWISDWTGGYRMAKVLLYDLLTIAFPSGRTEKSVLIPARNDDQCRSDRLLLQAMTGKGLAFHRHGIQRSVFFSSNPILGENYLRRDIDQHRPIWDHSNSASIIQFVG